jgi:hypothetical protein
MAWVLHDWGIPKIAHPVGLPIHCVNGVYICGTYNHSIAAKVQLSHGFPGNGSWTECGHERNFSDRGPTQFV